MCRNLLIFTLLLCCATASIADDGWLKTNIIYYFEYKTDYTFEYWSDMCVKGGALNTTSGTLLPCPGDAYYATSGTLLPGPNGSVIAKVITPGIPPSHPDTPPFTSYYGIFVSIFDGEELIDWGSADCVEVYSNDTTCVTIIIPENLEREGNILSDTGLYDSDLDTSTWATIKTIF